MMDTTTPITIPIIAPVANALLLSGIRYINPVFVVRRIPLQPFGCVN
jgi:hypothetical protein